MAELVQNQFDVFVVDRGAARRRANSEVRPSVVSMVVSFVRRSLDRSAAVAESLDRAKDRADEVYQANPQWNGL